MTNKELITELEGLTLNLSSSTKIFQGAGNERLKNRIFTVIDEYNAEIKKFPKSEWENDKQINKILDATHKKIVSLLHQVYDNLFDHFQDQDIDDSDSSAAATAAFLSSNIDPLRMKLRQTRNNPRNKTHKINGKQIDAILMAGGRGFKIYSYPSGLIVDKGREKVLIKEDSPEFKIVIDYVNLRYHNIDKQKEISQTFHNWLKITKNPAKKDNRTYKNFEFWPTKKLLEVIEEPYNRGIDGHDYQPYIEEIKAVYWARMSNQDIDKEINKRFKKNPQGENMSARSFKIGKTKSFGNVRIIDNEDEIVVTLHRTDVVVYNKKTGTIKLNSGGWKTNTTKTAINNALSQLEDIVGTEFPRISQVKGQWFLGDMPYRDGMMFAKRNKMGKRMNPMKRVRRNPNASKAQELSEEIMKEFNSQKHYSWEVFDRGADDYDVTSFVQALRKGEDLGGDDLVMNVADYAYESASIWIKENVEELFDELEELDASIAADTVDEIRFKFEELANYNYPFPSRIFVIDPSTLVGFNESKEKKQNYYAMDYYLVGPRYSDEEAEKELKMVKKLGKKFGFTDEECEEVYFNSQGGTLGIAVITEEVEELYEAVLGHRPIELTGRCVLFIRNGANGSGDYHIKGEHTIKVKDARELVAMIDNEENTRYSLGDVFGTTDWKY